MMGALSDLLHSIYGKYAQPLLKMSAVSVIDEHHIREFRVYFGQTETRAEIANNLQCSILKRRGHFYVLEVDCPPHDIEHYDGMEFWVMALERGQRP